MANIQDNTPPRQEIRLLLAARGNPDLGQHPEHPPFGVPDDQLIDCSRYWSPSSDSAMELEVARHVRTFIDENALGSGNWVGGDVWWNDQHIGHVAYNGTLLRGEQGPLVRDGKFVFGKRSPEKGLAAKAEGWLDVLLSAVEASTDDDWYQMLSIRPDLAERLRTALERDAAAGITGAAPSVEDLDACITEGLPDDDRYTQGFRDATESLMLALREHVAPGILQEALQTALDAYGNNAPDPEDDGPLASNSALRGRSS